MRASLVDFSGDRKAERFLPLARVDVFRQEGGVERHVAVDLVVIDGDDLIEIQPDGGGRVMKRFVFPPIFGAKINVLSHAKIQALLRGEIVERSVGDLRATFVPLGPEDDPVEVFDRAACLARERRLEEEARRVAEEEVLRNEEAEARRITEEARQTEARVREPSPRDRALQQVGVLLLSVVRFFERHSSTIRTVLETRFGRST